MKMRNKNFDLAYQKIWSSFTLLIQNTLWIAIGQTQSMMQTYWRVDVGLLGLMQRMESRMRSIIIFALNKAICQFFATLDEDNFLQDDAEEYLLVLIQPGIMDNDSILSHHVPVLSPKSTKV